MSNEAMKLALKALNNWKKGFPDLSYESDETAIKALEEALAKQEQGEPVAWMRKDEVKAMTDIEKQAWTASQQGVDGYWSEVVKDYSIPLYTTPQQRKPLTDEQIDNVIRNDGDILLDHIYEYGTSAEGITERLRSVARAAINAVENTKGD